MEDNKPKKVDNWDEEVFDTPPKKVSDWEEEVFDAPPKSTAPLKDGGESGARITPSTSTLPSGGLKSESWTKTANPLKPKEQPIQVPFKQGVDIAQTDKIVQPKLKAEELGKGLDLFQQQANQLNEEYKANPTPELEEQMKQMAINYKDTKDAYAKAMFEEKHLGGSIGKKKVEDESVASDLYNSFKAGSEALGASLANTPSFLYDVFALPQNLIAKYTGLNVGASADQFAKNYNIPKNEVAAAYTAAAEQTKANIDEKYDKSITEYISDGEYGKATKMVFNSVAESLPITLSLMVGNYGGVTPLASTMGGSVVFGTEKKQQLDQENPNLDEATKTSNALSTGLFEGIFENFGLTKLGGIAKEVFLKQGKEAAQDIAKQSFREVYAPLVKKYVGVGAGESISEMETQFANNVVDKYSGVKPDLDLRDGVIEAGLIGLASGGTLSAPVAAVDVFTTKEARAKAKENAAKIQSIEADIANPLVSDEVKETLSNEIGVINTEMADLKEAENKLVKNVPIEKREAVAQNWRKIDALEESLPTLSEDAKKAVEQKIIDLENENNSMMATPEAKAGDNITPIEDGKENDQEGRQENVLKSPTETTGVVEAAPIVEPKEDVESKAKEIIGESTFNKLKKEGYTIEKGKFNGDDYASFFGIQTGVLASEFEKAGLKLVKPSKKIKVYRGKGKNVSEGENEGLTWVAEDRRVAENYSADNNIEESEIAPPRNPFELPEDAMYVKGSDIANRLRLERDRLLKNGKISIEEARANEDNIKNFEKSAGEKVELYTSKINNKDAVKHFVAALKGMGFDGLLQKEGYSADWEGKGEKSNTYGIFKDLADVNIQQPMGESKVDDGAVGETPKEADVAKEELPKEEVKGIFTDEDDRKIKDIAVDANTNIGKYVQNKPTGKKDKSANNIYEYEAINPFTNKKVVFKKKTDAVDYVIKEVAKATTKSGREEIFNKQQPNEKNPTPLAINIEAPKPSIDVIEDDNKVEVKQTIEEVEKDQTKETQVLLNGEAEKRRKAGKFIKDTIEYVRNAVNKGVRGKKGEVKFAEGVPNMPFTYKLVEADEVQPSHIGGIRNQMHFIPEAQPKNRNDEGSKAAEIGFANNPRFNEMGENTNAYSGAPVVNERNEVVQGNNRSAGLKLGYKQGVKKYKNDLIANAEKFGFTKEQVEGMKNPILVREVAFNDEGAIEFGNYDVKDLETGGKRRLDPVALVKRIPIKTKAALTKLLFTDEGTLNKSIRENSKKVLELISPFINQAQRNTLLKDGDLSASGVQDIEAVVQQFLFDNGDMALPDFFEGLSYKQKEGIRKSLPSIFSAGIDADIIPEIQNAILAVSKFEASGLDSMNNWLNQPDMFLDGKTPRDIYTPQELAIARLLIESKGQAEIIEKFKEFAKAVEGTPDTPATLLDEAIEGTKGQSKEEALKQIFNVQENESKQKDNTGSGKEADSKTPKAEQPKPAKPTEKPTEPKNATDVAKIYRNLFKFSPQQSIWAARLFDAKAAFMSKVLGISKEEYYSQYWFGVNEGDGGLSQVEAWHGSPYSFDKFTTEKIGTGEGAQAFGWGLYFTDLESIAKGYAENLAKQKQSYLYKGNVVFGDGMYKTKPNESLEYDIAAQIISDGGTVSEFSFNKAKERLKDYFKAEQNEIAISQLENIKFSDFSQQAPSKNLYKVSLHKGKTPDQYTWLEWDKKLTEQQSAKIVDALKKEGLDAKKTSLLYDAGFGDKEEIRSENGKGVYTKLSELLGGEKQASLFLLKNGIDGIKYPAESISRGATSDTARGVNYVVFDENAVIIEESRLFQDRKGSWTKDAARMKRIINMYEKADSTTAVHEMLGHDYLDRIIEASATNKEFEADLRTIAEEYIKATKSKEKVEDVIKTLKDFDVENKTQKGTLIHEWFARTAEGYFIGETQVKQGSKLAKIFEAFRAHLVELYNNMTNKSYLLPSNEMKKVFRKVFGEEHFDMLNEIAQDEITQTKKDIARAVPKEVTKELADKFEALRKQAKGLGQTEEVSFDELLAAAQWLSTQKGVNILSVLPELKAMFPANEQMINENTRDFQQFFSTRGKKVSQTAQSAFDSPIVSEEGKQFVGDRLAEYEPEKLKEVLSDVRKAFEDYSIENMMDAWQSGKLPYKELPVFLTELQFRVNRAIKATANGTKEEKEYRKRLISYESSILENIIKEGKSSAQRLNYFKIFKGMSTEGKIMHLKRNFNKANEKTKALLDQAVKSLKEKLGKAYEDIDYFFSQNQAAEEKIGSLTQEVSDLNKQIEARAKRKDRERIGSPKRPENFKNKISVSDALAKYKKAKGLGQDLSSLSEQQTLAYALMQEKSKTIEQFVKEWNKVTGEKRDINELEETYKAVRQFATEVDGFEKDWFDTDSMIDESIEDYNNFKNDVELKKAKKDLELEIAKAEVAAFKKQMSDKDKEVKAREALKKREKQIVNDFLNSLGQDGLWQKYVQSNAGKIVGNLASKIGGKPAEKALLDKFITLATNEINSAINELTPNQQAQKTTPNYAQQLGDLISNQDKVAEVFDKAVKEFAEQYANDVNAQALLSKLSGLKNPFSEGLLGKALEKEADNYAVKIKDLAFKYVGLKPILKQQIIDQIVTETELTGVEAQQLKDDLAAKFETIISETETDVAGQLATALIADSKKTLGLMPKQSDYVKELLGYLKNKAKDYYKSETNKTLVDPIDQLKYAVEMLNDRNGKKIWDDSKAEVIKKIDADKTLSQTEKDNLKQHLDNYQNTVLDQLLSSNKLFNNIKQVIINETPFVKNGAVDWNKMITQAKGNVAGVKDIIRRSIEGKVQGYNTQQVDAVLDAIGREFDARINEKKATIIEKQLESIQGGKIIRQKKIAKGKVQKLIELENSGALDDGRFEQELGKYLGMKEMTPQKWARLRELIIDSEEAPEGNERDRAIEKMAAYVKLNSVGKTAEIYTALYYAGMLARPTTIIKNATGISEPIIRLMYKALTDRKYAKMMIEGLKRGDAKDIWGGGIVQGSKLDEETGIDGLPRVNILSQMGAQTNNKFVKFVAGGSKILDLLTMADAISQAMVGSGAEYGNFVNYLLEENKEAIKLDPTVPVLTKKQAREQAFSELTNSLTFDGAMMEAKSEFAKRGIIPSEARLKRRAYELTREMILPTQVRELAQQTALEEAYKSKLPSIFITSGEKKQERRLTENAGIFTSLGSLANEIVQVISSYTGGALSSAASVIPMSEARAKKLDENLRKVLAQRVLPFARGMSNVLEQALEKTPLGIIKGGISLGLEYKNYRKPTSLQEAVEHKYMMDRAKDKIAKSAASMILGGTFYITVMAISRAGDKEDEEENRKLEAQGKPTNYRLKTGFYSAGEVVKYGKNNIEKFTFPTNCMVIGGRVIPLSLLGTIGIGAAMSVSMYDNFIKKAEKQAGKVKDPESIERMQGYAMFMQSMGNTVLSMSAYSSLSELSESVSPTSNTKMSDYLSQMAVKSAVLPIPYVGIFGQVAQGARYLLGDKSAQTAIGLDERAWKEFGLQGIAYDRPVYNYRGKVVSAPQRNTEGIAGLVGIADKWKLDPIDNYLYKELNYNPTLDKRLSEDFADKENYGMTKEEYYDYGKKVGDEFNTSLEKVFPMLKSFDYPQDVVQYYKEIEGYTDKEISDKLKTEKREMISTLQNSIEKKNTIEYQAKKGIITPTKFNIEMTKANAAIQKAEISLMGYVLPE